MHTSSLLNMKKALSLIPLKQMSNLKILDIGGRGLNGDRSYKSLFDEYLEYHIADIIPGDNVTHVMPGEYEIPATENYYDIIVSGQTLEHVKNPFKLVLEMKRVLKKSCFMILIAPSTGPRHDVIDCWRFMDDSFKSIAEDCNISIVADWIDKESTFKDSVAWKDHIFIGQKV